MLSVGKTHVGKVRKNNEDYYYVDGCGLHVLADGMGGHLAGDVASKSAVDYVKNHFYRQPQLVEDMPTYLTTIVGEVNDHIYKLANSNEKYKNMGTTLIVAYVDSDKLYYAHVGDSRLYFYRQANLTRLTKDHSLVEELLSAGEITATEAQQHPQKNIITRAIGVADKVEVDTGCQNLQEQDLFLICTDGLSNMLDDEHLKKMLGQEPNIEKLADSLISEANKNGGSDNITVVIGQV